MSELRCPKCEHDRVEHPGYGKSAGLTALALLVGAPVVFGTLWVFAGEVLVPALASVAMVALAIVAGVELAVAMRRKPTLRLCVRCGWQWHEVATIDGPLRPEDCVRCRIPGAELTLDIAPLLKGVIGFGSAVVVFAIGFVAGSPFFGLLMGAGLAIGALLPLVAFWRAAMRPGTRLRCARCEREWDLDASAASRGP